jgi:F-type H+-transporting ATPase subunit c
MGTFVITFGTSMAMAAEEVTTATTTVHGVDPYRSLGAALAISIAALGGALGQGKTAAAALEGMGRNPQAKLLVPMIVGLALIESLVLYAFVIAFRI